MKHDLIDGRRGTYFDNVAGDYNAHCVLTYAVSFETWSDLYFFFAKSVVAPRMKWCNLQQGQLGDRKSIVYRFLNNNYIIKVDIS